VSNGVVTLPEITVYGNIPKRYFTADAAAIDALKQVLPISLSQSVEYSGGVFKNERSGMFFISAPDTLNDQTSSDVDFSYLAWGDTKWIGTYHTHPVVGTNWENFSADDLIQCKARKITIWLGTQRAIKKIVPDPTLLFPRLQILRLAPDAGW
jgi:hypothetical protein